MADHASGLLKRFSLFSIGPIVSAVISFFIVPITTWFVSPDEFGKATMFTTVLSMLILFCKLGMDGAFEREFTLWRSHVTHLLLNSSVIPLSFSLILGSIILLFYAPLSVLLFGDIELLVMVILALLLPVFISHQFNILLLRQLEQPIYYSVALIAEKLINLVVLVSILYWIDTSFKSIVIAQFISFTLTTVILTIINCKYWFSAFRIDFNLNKQLLKFGLPIMPAVLLTFLLTTIDKFSLRAWASFDEIGIYAIAMKIAGVMGIFNVSFGSFWSPTAYRWYEEGVANKKFVRINSIVISMSLLVFALIVLFKDVILLIFDESYLAASIIIPFLVIVPISEIIMQTTGKGIAFSRRTIFNLISSTIAVVFNVIGNVLLVPIYGSLGAAIATGLSFVLYLWVRSLFSRMLWFKFPIRNLMLVTIVLLGVSFINLFESSWLLNTVFALIIVVLSRSELKEVFNALKKIKQ
ncbi:O-antigen/teichoic acid export membrane protein [Alkalibacillus filiformis]|uniref:O-antigen/teichoic acid export membrane protein n=1 Tax=Alkalibacillus filiformis TaxID=200990 RepID=A0ABU0DWA4_9BACI|nr:lipopolysaccharide biosynthesis protein [Alkalibacillus filiformis]MDQ0352744.1 O-antigen/teichoic acid export membrane protein [Alkalibacillus filiformis]